MNDNKKSFARYQKITSENQNIPMWIQKTIERFSEYKGTAYDLGCGAGNISMYLLKKGWKVIAIDREVQVIENKKKVIEGNVRDNLKIIQESFENVQMIECDLVIAIHSLSWCNKDNFDEVWSNIKKSLKIGGRIAITLFGENDEFGKKNPQMSLFNRNEILELLDDFEIEGKSREIIEKEYDGKLANGRPHHWHIFIIMAKKIK